MSQSLLTVIVLTFNSEQSLGKVLEACAPLDARSLVVDSFSTDGTVALAERFGCEAVQHPFENYSAQRNWAQAYAKLDRDAWVLHVDSDEVPSPELCAAIQAVVSAPAPGTNGFLMRRLTYFWGRPIRHGHMNPSWHLRLFRAGLGACEERLYDQHFVLSSGKLEKLPGVLHDLQLASLESWTASHNRWSTAEAIEVLRKRKGETTEGPVLQGSLTGDRRMRKRWLKKNVWYRMPLLVKPFAFFLYSYVLKLGFLDGKSGFVYHVLQAFWFRFLVDAKIIELRDVGPEHGDHHTH